jgi:hypothetical protein
MQIAAALELIHRRSHLIPLLHITLHKLKTNRKSMKENQIIVLTIE